MHARGSHMALRWTVRLPCAGIIMQSMARYTALYMTGLRCSVSCSLHNAWARLLHHKAYEHRATAVVVLDDEFQWTLMVKSRSRSCSWNRDVEMTQAILHLALISRPKVLNQHRYTRLWALPPSKHFSSHAARHSAICRFMPRLWRRSNRWILVGGRYRNSKRGQYWINHCFTGEEFLNIVAQISKCLT